MYDLVLRGGCIVDGSGILRYDADIAIKNGYIEKIGLITKPSHKELCVEGLIVAPGFIDMHSHADLFLLTHPKSNHRILQGVTGEIVGNCGFSVAAINDAVIDNYSEYTQPILGRWPQEIIYSSMAEYLYGLENASLRHNVGALIGCGALYVSSAGFNAGKLNAFKMNKLLNLLRMSLKEGALGLSFGLIYVPEVYLKKIELIKIASVVAEFDKIVTVHMRGEGAMLLSSIDEIIDVAEKSGASIHISHFKAAGQNQWGKTFDKAIKKIETARAKGLDITTDVYPYTAGSTTLLSLLPPWVQSEGVIMLKNTLNQPEFFNKVAQDMQKTSKDWDNHVVSIGWDKVFICGVPDDKYNYLVGKNIKECALDAGIEPINFVLKLICKTAGKVSIVIHNMHLDDVDKAIALPYSSVISDSIYADGGMPHPRMYGTFGKLLGDFVRERGILTLEDAIRKCTSMPADYLKLPKRGRLIEGAVADITIFDAAIITDRATYIKSKQYPKGIIGVIVNGKIALWNDEITEGFFGKVLRN